MGDSNLHIIVQKVAWSKIHPKSMRLLKDQKWHYKIEGETSEVFKS